MLQIGFDSTPNILLPLIKIAHRDTHSVAADARVLFGWFFDWLTSRNNEKKSSIYDSNVMNFTVHAALYVPFKE